MIVIAALTFFFTGCAQTESPLWTDVSYKNENAYTVGGGEIQTAVTAIEIEWVMSGVLTEYYDGESVVLFESSDKELSEPLTLRYLVEDGKLTVRYAANGRWNIRGLNKQLTVRIPQKTQLKELTVQCVSGSVTTNVAAERQRITVVDANVNCQLYQPYTLQVKSVSGNVTLSMPKDVGFTLEFSSVSGMFSSQAELKKEEKCYLYLGGENGISVSTVSGNCAVRLSEDESLGT